MSIDHSERAVTSNADNPPVLVLCRDLLFASKITATAQSLGVTAKVLRDPAQLTTQPSRRVVVDLNQPGALNAAAAWKRATGGTILGFVSHVDTSTIEAARASGFDDVLPRSRFVQVLPELLT